MGVMLLVVCARTHFAHPTHVDNDDNDDEDDAHKWFAGKCMHSTGTCVSACIYFKSISAKGNSDETLAHVIPAL